ncbi:protein transport protein Sec31, putative [Trypanosoma cruzi]|nr:protein transport protein Sec31, putative [Trypanosoma cruzi]
MKQWEKEEENTQRCRRRIRNESPVGVSDVRRPLPIPLTTALLSSKLRRELQRIWDVTRAPGKLEHEDHADDSHTEEEVVVDVPPFKVGTMEMYRRFPKQYDIFMRRHDCQAVHEYLDSILLSLQQTSATPSDGGNCLAAEGKMSFVRVADFGCGTGRIASMVSRHPAVGAVYCYDIATPMLRECLINVVCSVAESRQEMRGVCICPSASACVDGNNNNNNNNNALGTTAAAAAEVCLGNDGVTENSDGVMLLCARPVSFGDVQQGFLATHTPCHLVVCAWSLSYVMRAQWGDDRWHAAIDATVAALIGLLDTSGPAALVIIETLGTDTTKPRRNNTLLQRLESEHGFERRWVRTDYNFCDVAEAVRLTRFFFGDSMARRMAEEERTALPECTGIWTLWRR